MIDIYVQDELVRFEMEEGIWDNKVAAGVLQGSSQCFSFYVESYICLSIAGATEIDYADNFFIIASSDIHHRNWHSTWSKYVDYKTQNQNLGRKSSGTGGWQKMVPNNDKRSQ